MNNRDFHMLMDLIFLGAMLLGLIIYGIISLISSLSDTVLIIIGTVIMSSLGFLIFYYTQKFLKKTAHNIRDDIHILKSKKIEKKQNAKRAREKKEHDKKYNDIKITEWDEMT